uniref:Enhancer of translation termination 1-like n=1 Tax=Nicotiana sylvestris TaxID=4096 RepID=A0A1U7XQ74_NICSY|nr:PREDICTED: enhancer of translation termination 1-like [Nicotiana sylvestris]
MARKRESAKVSKEVKLVMVEEAHPRTEEISEDVPSKVPESSGDEDVYHRNEQSASLHVRRNEQSAIVPEGSDTEALLKLQSAPNSLLREINIDDSLPGPTFSKGQFRKAPSLETPGMGTTHEGEDIFCECFMGVDDVYDVSDLDASMIFDEAHQILNQEKAEKIEQLREEAEVKEAETLEWKQNMDRLASEKDMTRGQLSLVESELAKVTSKVEKVKAEVEAVVDVYQADAEAADALPKEISDVVEVQLSCVVDHSKRQSWRETLEEIHACGFDLTTDIENVKVLEAEAEALLSDNDDSESASGSESGEDKDEAPGED